MLQEEKNVRQIKDDPPRRWFFDDYFDLIVWLEPDASLWGFQLCYDREHKPRALTWTKKYGYKHNGINNGESIWGSSQASPVLTEDGLFDAAAVLPKFEQQAEKVPPDIRSFVLEKLRSYKP